MLLQCHNYNARPKAAAGNRRADPTELKMLNCSTLTIKISPHLQRVVFLVKEAQTHPLVFQVLLLTLDDTRGHEMSGNVSVLLITEISGLAFKVSSFGKWWKLSGRLQHVAEITVRIIPP